MSSAIASSWFGSGNSSKTNNASSSWFGSGSSSKTNNASSGSSHLSKAKTAMPVGNAALEKKCKAKKNQRTNQCENFVAAQKKKKADAALIKK